MSEFDVFLGPPIKDIDLLYTLKALIVVVLSRGIANTQHMYSFIQGG